MSKEYGFFFDADRCLKCWSCEVACKQWNGIKAGSISLRKVAEVTSGSFPDVKRRFMSLSCRHCANPSCAAACPAGAISKRAEDGIVVVDQNMCTGCRTCLEACPFSIPQYNESGKMQKCDMCLERLEHGQGPFCVENCPTGALQWSTLGKLSN